MEDRKLFARIQRLAATCASSEHPDPAVLRMLMRCMNELQARYAMNPPAPAADHAERIRELEQRQAELEQEIEDLQDQIDDMEISVMDLDAEEPSFPGSLLYSEWEDRKAELEADMDDLEAEMDDLESQLDDVVSELNELRP